MHKLTQRNINPAKQIHLNKFLIKRYEECLYTINISGEEIKPVANTMSKHIKLQFKANDGWLWLILKGAWH